MYRRILCLLLLFILHGVAAQAQNQSAEITGIIHDEDGTAVPNASVSLYDSARSEIITGSSSNASGEFSFDAAPGSYILEITYVSYAPHQSELEITEGEHMDLGNITLIPADSQLEEIIVEGERSYMRMNFDSRVFSVGEDITSMGGSALDVLDNVPSLSTDFEGNVSLRGNQGVQILINGRPSSLVRDGTDALGSIPSDMIKEVEVITNPSARYSAQGSGGIINIVLRDDVRLGFNGSFSANTGYPHDHEVSSNVNYHKNNINWFASSNIEYESRPGGGDVFQRFSSPDTSYIYEQISESQDYEIDGRLRMGAEMFLPSDQVLTATAQINMEGGEDISDVSYIDYTQNMEIFRQITREDIEEARENDYDFRLEYEKRFDTDHVLSADIDYEFGREREHSSLIQLPEEAEGNPLQQRTAERERYSDIRIQSDYERPVGEDGRFETGFRSTLDWMDNSYNVEELDGGTWTTIPAYDDNFIYSEMINALYATYSHQILPFTYQLGLRAEQTSIQTELNISGEKNDQSYLNLFPSLFLTYQFNENNSIQASYSRRLRRPWSRMLLPFSGYSDSRNISRGNPALEPEFSNSFETGWLRHWGTGSVLSSVYYRYRTGVIEQITSQEENPLGDLITVRSPVNLATEEAFGVEFTADQEITSNMQLSGSLNYYNSQSEGVYEGEALTNDSNVFQSRLRVRWRFIEGWNFQSSLRYQGPRSTTQGRRSASSFVNLGLSKDLFDGVATVSLNVRDLLNSRQRGSTIENQFLYSERTNRWSSRSFRLHFRYRFDQGN